MFASITCGNCHNTHTAVDIVRACFAGQEIGACTWLVADAHYDFDGLPVIGDCGAESTYDDRGWWCVAGHEHVTDEARAAEGWDYAEDAYDAGVITAAGKNYRPMGHRTVIDPAEASRVAHAVLTHAIG